MCSLARDDVTLSCPDSRSLLKAEKPRKKSPKTENRKKIRPKPKTEIKALTT